ncbi:MAG: HIT family protein [Hydrogenophilales bacterium 12-61-10]|nr:MAG: HIT family protein [Hydrogenophilales bacterium 12-61-10]OYX32730.1 MAG: HIT family protein [Hydrogenophilales bacterium 32-62-9]
MNKPDCPLCLTDGGGALWRDALCRVVLADEPDYPGFLRVILNAHVKEMTDLPPADQAALMHVVFAAEAALREVMQPDKINLASLGNVVPHLHWHVIPRFADDPHFPNPVWGSKTAHGKRHAALQPDSRRAQLVQALTRRLAPAPETESPSRKAAQ